MSGNMKLIAEARQWAWVQTETHEETTASVIRSLADALEAVERQWEITESERRSALEGARVLIAERDALAAEVERLQRESDM